MSDITKCEGKDCPVKDNCWRFLAPANKYWQAYFKETPKTTEKGCEYLYERR